MRRNRDRDERRGEKGGTKSPYQKQFLRPGAGAIPKSDCRRDGGDEGLKMGRRKTDLPIGIIRVVIFLENDVARVSLSGR